MIFVVLITGEEGDGDESVTGAEKTTGKMEPTNRGMNVARRIFTALCSYCYPLVGVFVAGTTTIVVGQLKYSDLRLTRITHAQQSAPKLPRS